MADIQKPRTRGSLFPVLAMMLFFLVADTASSGVRYFGYSGLFGFVLMGALQAQAGILCILGGAVGRSWILSFLRTAAMAIASALAFLAYEALNSGVQVEEVVLLTCGIFPPMLLCGCIPFLLLRGFYGWHLTRSTPEMDESHSLQIEDFFLAMIVSAALMAIVKPSISFAITDGDDEILQAVLTAVPFIIFASAIAVVPVSIMYFGSSTRRRRIAVLFFFAILGLVVCSAVHLGYQFWNGNGISSALIGFQPVLLQLGTSTVLFSFGLVILHWSGFRWATIAKNRNPIEPIDPLVEHKTLRTDANRFRKTNRIAAAVIILASIAITVSISHFKSERLKLEETLRNLNSAFLLEGGFLERQGRTAVAMRVPPTALHSDIDLSKFNGLTTLSLSGTQLTESNLKAIQKMTSLVDFDASHTSFCDSSIKYLSRQSHFQKLSLAGTEVTVTGVNQVVAGRMVLLLDIGNLNLDDNAIKDLHTQNVRGLNLRGNPITDKSLRYLDSLQYLDLSETRCDGSELGLLAKVRLLKLDGTLVDDAAIAKLLASNNKLKELSLRNTQVTDATLKTLSQHPQFEELELGDGEITQSGLEAAAYVPSYRLALNSRKFTGKLFASWRPTIRGLDLSHSGVSDSDVHYLANVVDLRELSLAYCDITNQAIEQLVALNLEKIDLTGTKVTAAVASELFPQSTAVYVSAAQCNAEELAHANPRSSLRIGLRFDSKNY